ncbi:MAG: hypothetical protein ABI183_00265, partial [Polyangiaceae bacterium]
MFRAPVSIAVVLGASLTAAVFSVACKNEVKPPVSDAPGNGASGSGGGGTVDGGGDGGGAGNFVTFDGFTPTGIAADGDT